MRRPKSAHKNANSSRRQTNYNTDLDIRKTLSIRDLHFIKFDKESILKEYIAPKNREIDFFDRICNLFGIISIAQSNEKIKEKFKVYYENSRAHKKRLTVKVSPFDFTIYQIVIHRRIIDTSTFCRGFQENASLWCNVPFAKKVLCRCLFL